MLGAEFLYGADVVPQAFRFAQYRLPTGAKFELLTPIAPGFVERFLDARGDGIHHLTLRVPDLPGQLERLRAGGIEPILVNLDDPAWREALLHPRDAHGALIQLAEPAHSDDETAAHMQQLFPEAVLLADLG